MSKLIELIAQYGAQCAETKEFAPTQEFAAEFTRIAALEAENATLRHDIERAVQRNTDLLAEVEALRAAVDEYALGDERYKYVRRVNANQFARLYQRNIKEGIPFDDLIDAARKGEHDEQR